MSITAEVSKIILDYVQELVPEAECRRAYLPVIEPAVLAAVGKPVVAVLPVNRIAERLNQGGAQKAGLEIHLCISAKLQNRNSSHELFVTEIDGLINIAEKLHAAFLDKVVKQEGRLKVTCEKPEHLFFIDVDLIENANVFLSVVAVNAAVRIGGGQS